MDNLHANGNDRKDWTGWSGWLGEPVEEEEEEKRQDDRLTQLRENMWKREGMGSCCCAFVC